MTISMSHFIDIHVHILPGIDDGPKTLFESAKMAQMYMDAGVRYIIATPHCIPGTAWATGRKTVHAKVHELRKYLKAAQIELKVFPGMEIAYHENLIARVERGVLQTLGGTKTYLLEPQFNSSSNGLLLSAKQMIEKGYGVIVAHPERIPVFQKNSEVLLDFVSRGGQIQVNIGSILGKFGETSKKTAMYLLAQKSVQYLASDAHSSTSRPPPGHHEWQELSNKLGDKLLAELCVHNPRSLFKKG